jgi:hypothetical protein
VDSARRWKNLAGMLEGFSMITRGGFLFGHAESLLEFPLLLSRSPVGLFFGF